MSDGVGGGGGFLARKFFFPLPVEDFPRVQLFVRFF